MHALFFCLVSHKAEMAISVLSVRAENADDASLQGKYPWDANYGFFGLATLSNPTWFVGDRFIDFGRRPSMLRLVVDISMRSRLSSLVYSCKFI